ncbi:MAG: LLM class flavin-dependent oxidoreductase [Alphaproteobacteria bacterium]|jgi:alkanesulfonate monooxygenase SsuD/methylene tetrahydromethanopterin reductase-like flavin-dependent oxidoreductase (luciferase family)|nr:LLM class flavin-dependent oxidoreductase [Alphaproteobacteria bacterium]MBT4086225.1 LLM class flavin-dependent oxidoreductase [Alphaproteobacteria bacterium]MBT4543842.1 LLM class flavin-dependent oxidoreductase [Alphaproteobacteria bacterium]MBT7744822.1 LLM class flavin-dependent oxidoreductase [Alphaproteobacteria bacterium]
MQHGLCSLGDHVKDPTTGKRTTQEERHRDIMEYFLAAEPMGFNAVVAGEHHFSDFIMSAPHIFLAWLAGQTKNLRLATGITLLPNHDPVFLAEDFATLDVVSGGRAEIWVGKGVEPYNYDHFGQDFETESHPRQQEGLELLKKLWTEENINWEGKFRPPLKGVTLEPRPVQNPHPPMYVACGSALSAEVPAKLGINIVITGLSVDLTALPAMIDRYLEVWEKSGHKHEPHITFLAHVHVAETTQEARDHLKKYQFDFQRWVFSKRMGMKPEDVELPARITELDSPNCAIASGSVQEVTDKVGRLMEMSRCDRFIYQGDYGAQPWNRVMSSLEMYAAKILPEFK